MELTESPPQIDLRPGADLSPHTAEAGDQDVRAQVWALVATLYPDRKLAERRRENRYPFPYLMHLTPVDERGDVCGKTVAVVGKHLSERGLGFYHPRPLPHRHMIISLETPNGDWLGFLIDLSWCRFTKQGWYESGGRFLEAVDPPMTG